MPSTERRLGLPRPLLQAPLRGQGLFSSSSADVDEKDVSGLLPDRQQFSAFYRRTVKPGKEMRLDQFLRFEAVSAMLDEEQVTPDDINQLWVSAVGDAAGLNEEEAYELLCMVSDIPEPQDQNFLDTEFEKLAGGKDSLPFFKFLQWEDVQSILDEEVLSMEQISDMWKKVAGDLNQPIDRKQFGKINALIDTALEEAGEEENFDEDDDAEEEEEIDLTGVDIWDPAFDPRDVFDDESLEEITAFFEKTAGLKGISLKDILGWRDIQEMIGDGLVSKEQVEILWSEASKGKEQIDLDAFLRLNLKLDLLLEESEDDDATSGELDSADDEEDAEAFYRSEFSRITGGGPLMRLDMLLGWAEVAELIEEGVLTEKKVGQIFESLPKEPMGIPANAVGITEDTFVAFNGMLDLLLEASGSGSGGKAETPAALVSEKSRPMPTDRELKMGSLTESREDSTTGLSASELELMETLDKADNMLNSGSFSDFDQLIGDMNDPRLQALRDRDTQSPEVRGSLLDIVKNLKTMARDQKRCGIDRPSEEDQARLRDLCSALIETAPKAYLRDTKELLKMINGRWKLLYTNSEMFEFYNGITGFVNVVCYGVCCSVHDMIIVSRQQVCFVICRIFIRRFSFRGEISRNIELPPWPNTGYCIFNI